jgi:DNA-directed RNA polymerase specialized sigma24 family protein
MDLSLPEVADAIGVPLGTVKSRVHHATQALRAALEADARSGGMTKGGTA